MTATAHTAADIPSLGASLEGQALAPGDLGWEAARQAWNVLADQRPAAVVYAESADDVAATVRFAAANGLRVAAQGTGHAATALESLEGTILLKTMRMGGVEIDPAGQSARVEAGALWGDVAVAAGEHGLTALSGSSPDVGVVGYTLGGGVGWLGRRHGLAANSVTAIDLVTADGELRRVDASHEPALFWALRGGGGSFGVVTAMEFRLFPIAEAFAGSVMWPAARGADLLAAYREWAPGLPADLTSGIRYLTLPPIPEVPEPLRGVPVVDLTVAYVGDEDEGARLLEPMRAVAEPMMDTVATVPSSALCRIYGDPEQPTPGVVRHALLEDLPREAVEAIAEVAGPDSGSPLLMVALRHLGGALAASPEGAGALSALDGAYLLQAVGVPMAPGMGPAIDEHLRRVMEALAPWSTGREYMNFADLPSDASAAFDEDTNRRLLDVKGQVDPEDLFRSNHPVR